jgi:hypothetical protein
MNKEQEDILNDAYENYVKIVESNKELYLEREGYTRDILTKDDFIKESKYNNKFSERWGLKIEERELSWKERSKLLSTEQFYEFGFLSPFTDVIINLYLNQKNIPTKLITITYNDKTIESYE